MPLPEPLPCVVSSWPEFWSASSEPSVTSRSLSLPSRLTVTFTLSPTLWLRTAMIRPSAELISLPSTAVMMSPFCMPALSAGLPEVTSETYAPLVTARLFRCAFWAFTLVSVTPR